MFIENMKKKIFYLNRWDIIRDKKKEHQKRMIKIKRSKVFLYKWEKHMLLTQMLKIIFKKYNDYREIIILQNRREWAATRIKYRFHSRMLRFGEDQ